MSVSAESPLDQLRRFVDRTRRSPTEPYRSLEPFRLADAGIMAARDREVETLARLVTMYRGVLLYGESGTGKSSLINAGLLPRLIDEGFWPHRIRVQPHAGRELVLEPIAASDEGIETTLPSAFAADGTDGQVVLAAAGFIEAVTAAAGNGPIALVFDQFEELVTLFSSADAMPLQGTIVDALSALLRAGMAEHRAESRPMVRVKLLFAFREDYLASLKPLLQEQPELIHQSLRLVAPPLSAAEEIIRAPFEKYPGTYRPEITPQLAGRIAASLAQRSGDRETTPLSELQIACTQLWHAPDPSALLDARGVDGLLEDHLEQALAQFPGRLHDAAITVLGQMITDSNTRNVVAAPDLMRRAAADQEGLEQAQLGKAIELLETKSGLIRRERRHGLDLFELTSEFLIPWISRQRDQLAAAQARRHQDRRDRRQRLVIAVITVILAAFVVLAKTTLDQRNAARRQRTTATDVELASTAQSLLSIRPDVSAVLALAAYRSDPGLAEVRNGMTAALEQARGSGSLAILHGSANSVTGVTFDPAGGLLASASADGTVRLWSTVTHRQLGALTGTDPSGIFSLAFDGSGTTIAAGQQDGTVRVWDVATRQPLDPPISVAHGIVVSVAFSPDGRWLAAAGLDQGVSLIRLADHVPTGPPLRLPQANASAARSIAFSPDSKTLATAGNTGIVQFWNVATRRQDAEPLPAVGALYAVAFDPRSNNVVAAAGLRGSIELSTIAYRNQPSAAVASAVITPPGQASVNSLAFSPNGRMLAAGSAADTVQLYDLANDLASGPPLTGHDGVVTSVAFSRDGSLLASASTDRTIRLWRTAGGGLGSALPDNLRRANAIALSPDGRSFAAGGPTGIFVWPMRDGVPVGAGTRLTGSVHVRALAFDPSDGTLASGSQGGTFAHWSLAGRRLGIPATDPRQAIYAIAYSHDGRLVAVARNRGTITLSEPGTDQQVVLRPGKDRIFSLAFSPNGSVLASGGDDRTIHLWRISAGAHLSVTQYAQLTGDSDAIFSLAFGPTGTLASGSADGTARLWDPVTAKEIGQPLLGHHGWVRAVAFSPDGGTLVTGDSQGTIRLWQTASGTEIGAPLSADSSGIEALVFSPNGRSFMSAGDDGAVRVWSVDVLPGSYAAVRQQVCSLVGGGLSRMEWSQYAPNVPFANPCG
jgi:WD40 repeat protein